MNPPQSSLHGVESNQWLLSLPPRVKVGHHLLLDYKCVQEAPAFLQCLLDDGQLVAFAVVAHGFLQGGHVVKGGLGLHILDGQTTCLVGTGIELCERRQ